MAPIKSKLQDEALRKAIEEIQTELYDRIMADDDLSNFVHDKCYDLLPLIFAARPKMEQAPHNVPLEFASEWIWNIIRKPKDR